MPGQYENYYVQQFKAECGLLQVIPPENKGKKGIVVKDEDMRIADARKILLFITKGRILASKLVDLDGKPKTLVDLCRSSMDEVEEYGKEVPVKLQALQEEIDILQAGAKRIDKILSKSGFLYDPEAPVFRRNILNSNRGKLASGIHFFDWDGQPRKSEGIEEALCTYPMDRTKMAKTVKAMWLLGATGAVALGAYGLSKTDRGRNAGNAAGRMLSSPLQYARKRFRSGTPHNAVDPGAASQNGVNLSSTDNKDKAQSYYRRRYNNYR